MHLPDGFIDAKTAVSATAISAVGVGFALRRLKKDLPPNKVPLLGLAAAFLFVAQMVNFPIAGGTSGHLMGGTLIAALLGPSAALVVLTTVLIVQCLLFADGGIFALGANLFNMGLIGALAGYAIYRTICRWISGHRGQVTGIAFAGWCSTVLAALSCAGQLAWSRTVLWPTGSRAMAGIHVMIGIGEGLISALVLAGIARTRPELISDHQAPIRTSETVSYGLLLILGLAVFVAPFACPWPDGLESVAERLGFLHSEGKPLFPAVAPDYKFPGLTSASAATALAATLGTVIAFGSAWILGRMLVPERSSSREL